MTKKEQKEAARAAAQKEQERTRAIAEFNVNNMGRMWIDAEKVPTSEDIENAKKEYEEFTNVLQEKKDYLIADKANALRVAKFMKEFIDRNIWTGRSFVGVLNFHALIEDFIKNFDEENPVDLVLEYAPMQFAYLMFENYGGVGIESANWMAEKWDEYLPIFDKLYELNEWYKLQAKKSESLKQKWAAMEQGYYMVIMDQGDEGDIVVNSETGEIEHDAPAEPAAEEK